MCGIAGFTHIDHPPAPAAIHAAVVSIRHRGPDQHGIFHSPTVSLAAVRLRIIDLAGGDQPMHSGDTTIVFNGEIYNHQELRHELEQEGVRFRSHCDTEVVLEGFRRWDTNLFGRLRGMFAFAVWQETQRRLVLVRDRMGIKPLYLYCRGCDLHFASELKALFAHPAVPRQLDLEGLNLFLSLNYIPSTHTLAAGIHKLPPGCFLEWTQGRCSLHRFWKLELQPQRIALSDATAELDHLLRSSVKEHLVSDVPLGIWSSGGLDSSTILHYAAEQRSNLKTFSVSFRGRSFDESPWFRETARRYGTDHHEFDLSTDVDIVSAVEAIAAVSDEPSADAGALPVWFLSAMCRRHVTVALSGEGADELFGGYATYLADRYSRWLRRFPQPWRAALHRLARLYPPSDDKVGLDYKLQRFTAGALLDPIEAHFYWNGTFSSCERREILQPEAFRLVHPLLPPPAPLSLNYFLHADQLGYLPDDILYKCDRMSMAHSLEVRPPFLDHRIVEFAARLPENFKIRGNTLKYVLRRLMRDKLPHSVLRRSKQGFDIPAHHWFRTILKPLLLDTVTEQAVRQTGVLQWKAIDRVIQDHLHRRANYGYHLWGLLIFLLWIKRWNISTPALGSQSAERLHLAISL